jgi:hypothetical protein
MSMLEYGWIIGAIAAPLATYLIAKRMMSTDNLIGKLDEILGEIVQNTEMQKKIYYVGGILGSGVRQGIGIGKGGGKTSMIDIGMKLLEGFLGKKGDSGEQQSTQGFEGFGK